MDNQRHTETYYVANDQRFLIYRLAVGLLVPTLNPQMKIFGLRLGCKIHVRTNDPGKKTRSMIFLKFCNGCSGEENGLGYFELTLSEIWNWIF